MKGTFDTGKVEIEDSTKLRELKNAKKRIIDQEKIIYKLVLDCVS